MSSNILDLQNALLEVGLATVVDLNLDPALLRACHDSIASLVGGTSKPKHGTEVFSDRVLDAWLCDPASRAIASDASISSLLEDLYGRRPIPFQTLGFSHGTEQALHRDSFHFQSDPEGLIVAVWVAIEDSDERNGPVAYVPGSHRAPAGGDVDQPASGATEREHLESTAAEVVRRGLVPRPAPVRSGEALVWVGDLIHGGWPRVDRDRTRFSHVTHYTFEGATVWSPKRSVTSQRHLRRLRPIMPAGDLPRFGQTCA